MNTQEKCAVKNKYFTKFLSQIFIFYIFSCFVNKKNITDEKRKKLTLLKFRLYNK